MIHKAKDLSPSQKSAVESLLGRPVAAQESISVRALPQTREVTPERRDEIIQRMNLHFSRVDAQRREVSPEEASDVLDEALRSARPSYRPVR